MGKGVVKEYIPIKMEIHIKDSGKMNKKMGRVF